MTGAAVVSPSFTKPSKAHLPIIVGELDSMTKGGMFREELQATGAVSADQDLHATLLSMPEYNKNQYGGDKGSWTEVMDNNRSYQQAQVLYSSKGYDSVDRNRDQNAGNSYDINQQDGSQGGLQPGIGQERLGNQFSYVAHNGYQPSEANPSATSSFTSVNNQTTSSPDPQAPSSGRVDHAKVSGHQTSLPQVSSWSPPCGPPDTPVNINLLSLTDIDTTWRFSVMFDKVRQKADLLKFHRQGEWIKYAVTTRVPMLPEGEYKTQVRVRVLIQDQSGNEIAKIPVAVFHYSPRAIPQVSPMTDSRKRKHSPDEEEPIARKMAKEEPARVKTEKLYDQNAYSYMGHTDLNEQHASNNLTVDTNAANLTSGYTRQQLHSGHAQESPGLYRDQLSASSSVTNASGRGPSPQTPSWNSNPVALPSSRSPYGSTLPTFDTRMPVVESSSSMNPPLIRTSTLQAHAAASAPIGSTSTLSQFNPYAMCQQKAQLSINGNLEDMAHGWSVEEMKQRRRLVQFSRNQRLNTIHTSFEPVTADERQPNSICVSCIWWESKMECYVTSVDTIYLLESLVGVRFTVEEKNRIRRNLEGFRPTTVSKGKEDSEEFFKVIMGFTNPKPRNIEKDVKVFRWKDLTTALRKIIGKYSASYSSTAGMLSSQPATFRRSTHDEASEYSRSPSSRNGSDAGLASYSGGQNPYTLPSNSHGIASNSHTIGSSADDISVYQSHQQRPSVGYSTTSPPVLPSSHHTGGYPLYSYPGHDQLGHGGSNESSSIHHGSVSAGEMSMLPSVTIGAHHSMLRQPQHQHEGGHHQQSQAADPNHAAQRTHHNPWELNSYMEPQTSNVRAHSMYGMGGGQHAPQYPMASVGGQ